MANLTRELPDIYHELGYLTVDKLKAFIKGINAHPHYRNTPMLKMSGLKADLVRKANGNWFEADFASGGAN